MSIFTRTDWDRLAMLFAGVPASADGFEAGQAVHAYAGYKPAVHEAPNGDTKACNVCGGKGRVSVISVVPVAHHAAAPGMACPTCKGTGRVPNVDAGPAGKRYLHVAEKYLAQHPGLEWPREYLARAYYEICRVADALHVPDAYYPRPEDTTLRVLEYPSAGHAFTAEPLFPQDCQDKACAHCGVIRCGVAGDSVCPALAPGAGTVEHTDFDLFTIVCWRETPADLERPGLDDDFRGFDLRQCEGMMRALAVNPGLHIGQIGELVGLGPATPHRVPARPYVQRSIVAFAMPRLDALLPTLVPRPDNGAIPRPMRNQTVREWIAERMARSRYA